MPYTDKAQSLNRAKERAANAGPDADAFLSELLDFSAGIDATGTTHFRPMLCAAVWLEQSPQFQQLSEADGVVFTQMKTAIASLRSLQAAYDSAQKLIVPTGFEAVASALSNKRSPFGTSMFKSVVMP